MENTCSHCCWTKLGFSHSPSSSMAKAPTQTAVTSFQEECRQCPCLAKDADERPAASVRGLEHIVLRSNAITMQAPSRQRLLLFQGACVVRGKQLPINRIGDGIRVTVSLGFLQPLPFEQPALVPWSWQVSGEQMLRKIGSFTKCLQILPAGPWPILPSSPLRENMHVCPQPLSSESFLMGLVLKAWGGFAGTCVLLITPSTRRNVAFAAWVGKWRQPPALLGARLIPGLKIF